MDKLMILFQAIRHGYPAWMTDDLIYWVIWKADVASYLKTGSPMFDNIKWVKKSETSIRPEVKDAQ